MTQILVKNRAMINCKDNYCITPLNLAKDRKQIAEYLMNTSALIAHRSSKREMCIAYNPQGPTPKSWNGVSTMLTFLTNIT